MGRYTLVVMLYGEQMLLGYNLRLWGDFIRNKPRGVFGIASGKLGAERSRKREQNKVFSSKVLLRAFMQTHSRTRKRTLDTAEETDSVLDIQEKIDFEDSDKESEQKEPVIMGDRIVQADPALMDFSRPKIDDIQSSIFHPAIQANTFEINTFKYNGVTDEAIKLRLFPLSLRDKAKDWLHSEPAGSITTWQDLAQKFLVKFYLMAKTAALRSALTQFAQQPTESMCEAWERYKEMLRKCPHHGMHDWMVITGFYNGLGAQSRPMLDAAAGGALWAKSYTVAYNLIETMAANEHQNPTQRMMPGKVKAMVPKPVEVQTQAHQQGPSKAAAPSSKPLDVSKPTTLVSQKTEVSKKKRKEPTLAVVNESETVQTESESPLVKRPKKRELPTLTTEQTSLISQISSSYKALESDSQVHQHSSDMVHATVLTTQNQHLDGERLLAGVDLDDTITNIGVSSVFTEDPMVTLAPSCAQSSLQMNRFEGSTLEGELSKSSPIQMEVPLEGTTPLKTLAEIALTVEARSTIANDPIMGEASSSHLCDSTLQGAQRFEAGVHDSNPVKSSPIPMEVPTTCGEQQTVKTTDLSMSQTVTSFTGGNLDISQQPSISQSSQPHVMAQWLQDMEAQPSTVDDMLVDQISGLANLSQQLLTSDMGNQEYQAILLCFNEEVEQQKEKIVDEAEEDGNVDAWLSDDHVAGMDEVLARFRREYITIMGSNAKSLTPPEVYDAIMDVHKAQLKAFHLFGKALEVKLTGHEDKIGKLIKEQMDDIVPSQKDIKDKFQFFSEQI
ncbi:hypothetical protein AgCh_029364 [Apium graveolens]